MTGPRDVLLDDALALVRTLRDDPDGFAELLNHASEVEQHKLIVRLAQLVRIACELGNVPLGDVATYVSEMQRRQP